MTSEFNVRNGLIDRSSQHQFRPGIRRRESYKLVWSHHAQNKKAPEWGAFRIVAAVKAHCE
ncbi:hypothetical protein [Bradyrhizobium sp. Leo121]|uniref:hypothetical protein n=1 Tax=Bradyrhizobium sp. Leo121 TaxID=1571195 RepID=UPI001028D70D|nr:hypothetical protein [Bradyrhizobium sp. Leo121]